MATGRRVRADAQRSTRVVLEAAERVLSEYPAASLEQIAEAAGVARTTIHRRFATRDALVDALALSAWTRMSEAIDAARPLTAPPLIALHQATANVLQVKAGSRYALAQQQSASPALERVQAEVADKLHAALTRAQQAGAIRADADLRWARQVYLALLAETVRSSAPGGDPDALAERIVDTLLRGVGGPVTA